MSIEEVLEVIKAFFEALKKLVAAITGKEYPAAETTT